MRSPSRTSSIKRYAYVIAAGPESLEVRLFGWDEIPWGEIAFPSVRWALHHEREAQASGDFTTRMAPADPTAGIEE